MDHRRRGLRRQDSGDGRWYPAAMKYALTLLILAGCGGESVQSIVDAHRAAATAQLAKIAALAPAVEKQPLLTQDAWKVPAGVRLDFVPFGETYDSDMRRAPSAKYNTAVVFEHQLAKPSTAEPLYWESAAKDLFLLSGIDHTDRWLLDPACVLETTRGRYDSEPVPSLLAEGFDWLERTKYLLVLRLRTRQPPGLILEELEAGEMKTFSGGRIAGDALLFEIDGATCLGGVAIEGRSDDQVEVRNAGVHSQLRLKLAANTEEVLKQKLAAIGEQPR